MTFDIPEAMRAAIREDLASGAYQQAARTNSPGDVVPSTSTSVSGAPSIEFLPIGNGRMA